MEMRRKASLGLAAVVNGCIARCSGSLLMYSKKTGSPNYEQVKTFIFSVSNQKNADTQVPGNALFRAGSSWTSDGTETWMDDVYCFT